MRGTAKASRGTERPIAVIGVGIAGLTLAIRLRQIGRSVSVFEARGSEGLSEGAFLTLAPNGINALRGNRPRRPHLRARHPDARL